MSIVSQFPRKKFLPSVSVKESPFSYKTIQLLDYLSAEYNTIADDNTIPYMEFLVSQPYEGRPDLIANRFYGSTDLWWLICIFNGVTNPIFDLPVGKRLKIPRKDEIEFRLQSDKPRVSNPRVIDIP